MSRRVAPPARGRCAVVHADRAGVVIFQSDDRPEDRWIACERDVVEVARP